MAELVRPAPFELPARLFALDLLEPPRAEPLLDFAFDELLLVFGRLDELPLVLGRLLDFALVGDLPDERLDEVLA